VPFNWPRVYDQECTRTGRRGPLADPLSYRVYFQSRAPLGQSFTPTLSQVGFVQVFLSWDLQDTLTLNLREESITGPIVGSVGPVLPAWNIVLHYAEIDFLSPLTVVPGRKYVFEIVQHGSGRCWTAGYRADTIDYPGGSAILNGVEMPGNDLWFREGIIVPEPSTVVLLLFGGVVLAAWRRRTRQGHRSP